MDKAPDSITHGKSAPVVTPEGPELAASGWLGTHDLPPDLTRWAEMDEKARAAAVKLTGGVSPVSLALAWADWAMHLSLAPGKRMQLAEKAWEQMLRWNRYAMGAHQGDCEGCIEPLPQDRRFADPAWQRWPFNLFSQGFLLTQDWWQAATTGVAGMTRHHEDVVSFEARQALDRVAPSNFISTNPVVRERIAHTGGGNLTKGALNAIDDWQRKTAGKVPAGAELFKVGENVACTPGKVVLQNHLIELIQYEPTTAKVYAEPILVTPAWIMKYYILDLSPRNSLIRYLVEQGHTVFAISWKNPEPETDPSDAQISLDDYRTQGVMAALDAVNWIHGDAKVHLLGYCLGGTLAAICAATMARDKDQRLASLTMLAAQVDFEDPGEISLFLDDSQVAFLEAGMRKRGVLEGEQMAGAFQMLRSNDMIWSYRLNNYLLGERHGMNDLMAWNADVTRMPMRMQTEYLHKLFLENQLVEGCFEVDEAPIALTDIRTPVFAVGTVTDHVAPWRSVYKIHIYNHTDVTFVLTSGGHNAGIISEPGRKNRSYQMLERKHGQRYIGPNKWLETAPKYDGSWWPAWQQWLVAHSSNQQVKPPPIGSTEYPVIGDAPGTYVHGR